MTDLKELKPQIKTLLIEEGLGPALQRLKAALPEGSKAYNELILLEADLKDANLKMVRGSISQEDLDVKYNQLRERFLTLLENLEDRDFEPAAAGKGGKHGSLLYQIPGRMELEKETRCRVRIAYDEAVLLENIELTRDTRIKDVRIAEVMEVELIDPAETPAFSIRTFNRQEQFVERDEYTEWIFFVKPLREGQFPLLLRVSVIEKVGEKERVRDIVLEEMVVIVAEPQEEPAEQPFKPSGYVVGEVDSPAPGPQTKKRSPLRSAAMALAALVVFSGLTYAAIPGVRMNVDWLLATLRDTREAYETFAEKYQGRPKSAKAFEKLEEIDWELAVQDTSITSLEAFLETYPDGRFSKEAVELLLSRNSQVPLKDTSLKAIETYLEQNPGSEFADKAREKLPSPAETDDSTLTSSPVPEEPLAQPPKVKKTAKTKEPENITKPIKELESPDMLLAPDYFAFVKGGAFTMGCTQEQGAACESDENPAHAVVVGDFFIGRREVTNSEFCAFLNEKGNQNEGGAAWLNTGNSYVRIKKKGGVYSPEPGFEKYPVIAVSWYGAKAYCTWLSEKNQAVYRLPTEAEWEFAARGGQRGGGKKFAGSGDLDEVGWYASNAGKSANPVGMKKQNELGIFDLSGNVWEWCSDWSGEYPKGKADNPEGPPDGSGRVRRGGCWRDNPEDCRVSNRSSSPPAIRLDYLGFRIVKK